MIDIEQIAISSRRLLPSYSQHLYQSQPICSPRLLLHRKKYPQCCTSSSKHTRPPSSSISASINKARKVSFLGVSCCLESWVWTFPARLFRRTRRTERNPNGGKRRSGLMEFLANCSTGNTHPCIPPLPIVTQTSYLAAMETHPNFQALCKKITAHSLNTL